ncbi:prolactin-releasing peptide receptor-like [Porites lutea]|uniref:prolactin-releasing peptide receptor-like n=1 Tax=Porites lutea TaxID=51062 RepID=UPI003CC58B31
MTMNITAENEIQPSMNATGENTSTALNSTPSPTNDISTTFHIFTTLFFSLIIFFGLLGNSFVMATLIRWPGMRTAFNLLIANICLADLGVCVLAAPLRIIETFRGWIFGDAMCYVLAPLQDVFVAVSVITHTVIAFERHRAIASPFKQKITLKRAKTVVLVIWLASYVAAGVPLMIFLKNQLAGDGYYYCSLVFTSDKYRIAYKIYLVVLFIAVPLVLQLARYVDIIRVLRAKDGIYAKTFKTNTLQWKALKKRLYQKKRLVRMLVVIVVGFHLCYLPRAMIMLMREFVPDLITKPWFMYVDLITLTMLYLKHVINPLILCVMSDDFRAGCLTICCASEGHESSRQEVLAVPRAIE